MLLKTKIKKKFEFKDFPTVELFRQAVNDWWTIFAYNNFKYFQSKSHVVTENFVRALRNDFENGSHSLIYGNEKYCTVEFVIYWGKERFFKENGGK